MTDRSYVSSPEQCGATHHDYNGDGRCDWCGIVTIDSQERQPDALTVLRPGDRVLVVFRDDHDHIDAKWCLDMLRERFPDVEFSALVGADQVLVQPSEEAPADG